MNNTIHKAEIITVDTNKNLVSVMPLSKGVGIERLEPIAIPLELFGKVILTPGQYITYSVVNADNGVTEYQIHSIRS